MYALTTTQGTAMAETALCDIHSESSIACDSAHLAALAADDWDGKGLEDCSGNDALECIVCGESG